MDSFLMKHLTIYKRNALSDDVQLRFLKRLVRLLENGYPMIDSLEIIKWDKQLMNTAEKIIIALKQGTSIDKAFEQAQFHQTITAYLFFVRESGDILASIKKCVMMYENRLKYKKKFQELIRYPLILTVMFSTLLYFINQFVLPSFIDLFHTNTAASSTILFFMKMIEYLTIVIIGLGIILIILLLIWYVNKKKFSIEMQIKFYRKIPIYRKYLSLQTSFQFSTHLSAQLKTGMSLKDILQNMSSQKKLPIIAYYTSLMTNQLNSGLQVTDLLSELDFLEKQLANIFQKNTNNHALEKDLSVYADLLTEELQRKTMKAITLIQPIFFILVACFVIFIYMTLMWPMFQLIKTI